MLEKWAVQFSCFLLEKADLSVVSRNKLSAKIVESLDALPLKEIFKFDEEGNFLVSGKVIGIDEAKILHEHAKLALINKAEILIKDQIAYEAVVNGIHKTNGDLGQLFMRAGLWWEQQREKHLKSLAGQ